MVNYKLIHINTGICNTDNIPKSNSQYHTYHVCALENDFFSWLTVTLHSLLFTYTYKHYNQRVSIARVHAQTIERL